MPKTRYFSIGLTILLCAAVVLAACTRSATTDVAPTTTGEGIGGGGDDVNLTATADAAMNSILFQGQTQTAQALLSGVGGGPAVEVTSPSIILPTTTPTPLPPPSATPVPASPTQYTVKPGDWLYKIARDHGITPQALIAANPNINPNAILQPGTVLTLPGPAVPPSGGGDSGGKTYVVKPGDNLFRIALNNGATYQKLAELNAIPAPYTVFPGQVIKLP